MRKLKIKIKETLVYDREMTVEIPDEIEMIPGQINEMLDKVERNADSADDMSYLFGKLYGINTLEDPDSSLDSPSESEIEITDYDIVEE